MLSMLTWYYYTLITNGKSDHLVKHDRWTLLEVKDEVFVVVWTVGGLFDTGVLVAISNLYLDHRVHIQTRQLLGFDHSNAYLEKRNTLVWQHLF